MKIIELYKIKKKNFTYIILLIMPLYAMFGGANYSIYYSKKI